MSRITTGLTRSTSSSPPYSTTISGCGPGSREVITAHADVATGRTGPVLEGAALWPTSVAKLAVPYTAAVWLTADECVLSARMHTASDYGQMSAHDRGLIDKFLARAVRYQTMMLDAVARLGLNRVVRAGPLRSSPKRCLRLRRHKTRWGGPPTPRSETSVAPATAPAVRRLQAPGGVFQATRKPVFPLELSGLLLVRAATR